jgi:mRNA-binding protein PUF3
LLRDGYGNYVIQKLLDTLSRDDYDMFVQALKPELEKAKKVIPGKQCVSVSQKSRLISHQISQLIALKVEKKMYRYDRIDSPTTPRDDAPPTPGLSSSAHSPQSSSLPSTNTSTIDEPVHSAPRTTGKVEVTNGAGGVSIEDHAA